MYDPSGKHVARLGPFRNVLLPEEQDPDPADPLAHEEPATQAEWLWGREAARWQASTDVLPGAARVALEPALAERERPQPLDTRDQAGRVLQRTHASGAIEQFQSDPEGNLTAHLDSRGNWWQRRIESWDVVGAERSPLGAITQYGYSHRLHRSFVLDPNGTRTDYVRDSRQSVVEVRENGASYVRYMRSPGGGVLEERAGNGVPLVRYELNELGLHTTASFSSGETYRYAYDQYGNTIDASSSEHEVTLAYQRRLRCADRLDGAGAEHFYDANDRLQRSVLFENFVIDYEEAIDGVRVFTPDGAEHALWRSQEGALVRVNASGTTEAMVFDREGRLIGSTCWRGAPGAELIQWAARYRYDADGLLIETLHSEHGLTRYDYDADRRLVTQHGPRAARFDYRYDAAGNLTYTPRHAHIERHPNHLISHSHLEKFEHDERKRITKRVKHDGAEVGYVYDSADQLVAVRWSGRSEEWRAGYDGIGRRLWREFAGKRTTFYWDGDRLAAERAADGQVRLYVYANADTLVPFMWLDYEAGDSDPRSGVAHYLYTSPTGMPTRVESASGELEWEAAATEPYGSTSGADRPPPLRLRFAGHFYDEHLGLFYNRFRDYDPELGRYLQRDPSGHAGGPNLYAYSSRPASEVDLRGLSIHPLPPKPKGRNKAGPSRKLAEGETETRQLKSGLKKVSTGDADGGTTVRHYDENGKEVSVHKYNEHGQMVRAEMVCGPAGDDYDKKASRPTPADMQTGDQKGHAGPEAHALDQRAANTPDNILPEHEQSNKGPKKRFENQVPEAVEANPGKEVRTVHEYEYPDETSKRPSSSSHGVTADGERLPKHDTGPIPNSSDAKNTTLQSEQNRPRRRR